MTRRNADDLQSFLLEQDAATLAAVLLELSRESELVAQRLERLQLVDRPDRLAASFRRTLAGWQRAGRYLDWREARAFGSELETWLAQVEAEFLPRDPAAALALAQSFIESDALFFERADDSGGHIGSAVRAGCRLWLKAAAACASPREAWIEALLHLYGGDEYGARESLLRHADVLLDEPALRRLVASLEQRLDNSADVPDGPGPQSLFSLQGALSLLAVALRDPDVHVRTVLRRSPQPSAPQKEDFARKYLEQGRAADALRWLDGSWEYLEDTRLRLRAQALGALGCGEEGGRSGSACSSTRSS